MAKVGSAAVTVGTTSPASYERIIGRLSRVKLALESAKGDKKAELEAEKARLVGQAEAIKAKLAEVL